MRKLILVLILLPFALSAQSVNKYVCVGSPFTLSANDTLQHNWYKNSEWVVTLPAYSETPTIPGTYSYQVLSVSGGCTSDISDAYTVQVLPSLAPTITSPLSSVCSLPGNSVVLTANAPTGFDYNYQWLRNGVTIAGAVSATYMVAKETTVGIVNYSVNVSYKLNAACTGKSSFSLNVIPGPTKPTIQ